MNKATEEVKLKSGTVDAVPQRFHKPVRAEELAFVAAMVFNSVPSNQNAPQTAAVRAVEIARTIILESIRVEEELDKD